MKMVVQKLSAKKQQLPSKQDIEVHILKNIFFVMPRFSKSHEKQKGSWSLDRTKKAVTLISKNIVPVKS